MICFVLCLGVLTGCNTKKAYEEDCKTVKRAVKLAEKKSNFVGGKVGEDYIAKIIDDSDAKTSEGKKLKKQAAEFWDDYGEDIAFGRMSNHEIADAAEDLIDAFDDFVDAADDKGADTDKLTEYKSRFFRGK